jgi:neuroligin
MMLILMLKTYGNVVWSACLIADTKPKLKNHYRAHRLSFWLNLVPDLHRPGGQDIPPSHHLLNSQDEADTSQRSYFPSLPKSIWPGISSLTPGGTAVPNAAHGFNLTAAVMTRVTSGPKTENVQPLHTPSDGSGGGEQPEDGFAVYSTALSVTVAIGCSLLILNVLIFAGVYYQRDKQKIEVKRRSENGQMGHGGELELASAAAAVSMKHQPPLDPGGGGGPHHHHHHHQQQQTQLPPPEFADVLPAAHYYHPHHHHAATLPRPPPPPKMAPPPELVAGTPPGIMITAGGTLQRPRMHIEQPDAKNANTATLKKANLHGKVSQLANSIDELRV